MSQNAQNVNVLSVVRKTSNKPYFIPETDSVSLLVHKTGTFQPVFFYFKAGS